MAVTNDHKLGGLKQHSFILLHFWGSEFWNGCHDANSEMLVSVFLVGTRGEPHFLACCSFWSLPTLRVWSFSIFRAIITSHLPLLLLFHLLGLSLLLPSSFIDKDPCDHIEPTWIMQDSLPVSLTWSHLQSLFCHLRQHMHRLGTSWGEGEGWHLLQCCTIFQSGCTLLHSHWQCLRAPVAPHSLQYLVWSILNQFF